ncbi:MAG: hypothetical protein KC656_21675, partial [Myxococcales bacterium]|nr:hypothetical protein [Myxococcales bacterium]
VLALARSRPSLVPALNRLVGRAYFRPARQVAPSHRVFNIAMPPVHQECEYAIPLEAARDAMRELIPFVRAHRVDFVLEVRFVAADTGWLSPAHGRDSCQIGAYMGDSADRAAYFRGFEDRMLALDGRPHWGKQFEAPMRTVLARYPKADAWLELREALDPDGRFAGPFVRRMLT